MARILLVDDDDAVRHVFRRVLTRAGYDVEEAEDGAAALRAFRRQPSDLVITDIVMPEKDGLETIRELCRLYPGVRIVAISGGGPGQGGEYLDIARRFGAIRTLPKPFSAAQILAVVGEVLADPGA